MPQSDLWSSRTPGKAEHEFLPAAMEVMQTPPSRFARTVTFSLIVFVSIAVGWAFAAQMEIVVSANGRIVPNGKVKIIQAPEKGIVRAIHVRDGQSVAAGDVLIELDSTTSDADQHRLIRELNEAKTEASRLRAQLRGDIDLFDPPKSSPASLIETQYQLLTSRIEESREKTAVLDGEIAERRAELSVIRSKVTKIEQTLPLLRQRFSQQQSLKEKGFASQVELIDAQLDLIDQEKELVIQQHRLVEATAGLQSTTRKRAHMEAENRSRILSELAEASRRRDAVEQEIVKVEKRKALQKLRAPVTGVIQQLSVHTVGGVVTAAQALLVVVPDDAGIEVEAQVLNKDVGFVETGQPVSIKVETYDFTSHGELSGALQWVGTDSIIDERMGPVYPVRISLENTEMPNVVNNRRGRASVGMSVTADIVIGERRVIEYFLGPIMRYKHNSLRER